MSRHQLAVSLLISLGLPLSGQAGGNDLVVELYENGAAVVRQAGADIDGGFEVNDIKPGIYSVRVVLLPANAK